MSAERYELNKQLAQMLKGGVIMDVTTPEQARIAEEAGACAVMALERIPADIRAAGGVSRMSDPKMIKEIQEAVSIPVMAKCRIGHFVEAQILEAIEIDYIDESEVLSPADDVYHINKRKFQVPFVCGARDLGEALRRINPSNGFIRSSFLRSSIHSIPRSSIFFRCSANAPCTASTAIFILSAPFRHQKFYLLFINSYHCLSQILRKLCQHPVVFKVCYRFYNCFCPLSRIS